MSVSRVQDSARRSPLHDWHMAHGAERIRRQGQSVVARYGDNETDVARHLSLSDLTVLDRTGFKGAGTTAWLIEQGFKLPERIHQSCVESGGELVFQLSPDEYLIVRDPWSDAGPTSLFRTEGPLHRRVYALPRQDSHAWFFMHGHAAARAMSHLCAVDVRSEAFGAHAIAQTQVATVSTVVARQRIGALDGFHLFSDQTTAFWLWQAVLDVVEALGGSAVGVRALETLAHTAVND